MPSAAHKEWCHKIFTQQTRNPYFGRLDLEYNESQLLRLLLLAIEIASGGLAAKRPPAWARLSTQVDSQL